MLNGTVVRKGLAIGAAVVALSVAFLAGTGSGASAANGQPVILGSSNLESGTTGICRWTTSHEGGQCNSGNEGLAVENESSGGFAITGIALPPALYGVYGQSAQVGAIGQVSAGVVGGASGAETDEINGVWGFANNNGASGVFGSNDGLGYGVAGRANSGTGVLADSTNGTALEVKGKAEFSRSGTATITGSTATPKSSIVVNNVALTSKSLVLVTPQKNVAGVWVQAAVPSVANSRVTIFLNKTVTVSYPVAWMVIEKP